MDNAPAVSTRPYGRLVALGALGAFIVLSAFMWHSSRLLHWERPILTAADRLPVPFRGFWISIFEPFPFLLTTTALACVAAARGRTRLAVCGFAGCLGAALTSELIFKPLVDRRRTHDLGTSLPHLVHVGTAMFPSAHVTASAAWATFAWLILGRRSRIAPLLVLLPLFVGCSVLSRQLHYPADVIGGVLLGASVTYLAIDAGRSFGRSPRHRTSRRRARQRILAS